MNLFTISTFLFFTFLVALITYFKTKNHKIKTNDDYFLAGRGLSGVVIASSLLLANLSTEQIVGMNGVGYKDSMIIMSWETGAVLAIIAMAVIFLPKFLKSGITTIPDFLKERYDQKTSSFVSILFLLSYVVAFLPTVLYSGALVLNELFNIEAFLNLNKIESLYLTVCAIGLLGGLYVVLGGLQATAIADTINSVGLLIGGLMIPLFALSKLGAENSSLGLSKLVTNHPQKLNSIGGINDIVPFPTIFLGLLFNNLFYWCTNQSIIQRTLAAKNLSEGQKGVILAGFLKLIGPLFLVLPGVLCFHLYPDLKHSDAAYGYLLKNILPKSLVGFMGAVLFGAVLSTFNSVLNSVVTISTLNIYKNIKPQCNEKQLIRFGRYLAAILATISIIIAPLIIFFPKGLYGFLQQANGFINIPILTIVILGLFTKWATPQAAWISTTIYMFIYAIFLLVDSEINFLWALSVLFPLMMLLMKIISKIKPKNQQYFQKDSKKVDLTPWKNLKVSIFTLLLCLVGIYITFSDIGINFIRKLILKIGPFNPFWIFGTILFVLMISIYFLKNSDAKESSNTKDIENLDLITSSPLD